MITSIDKLKGREITMIVTSVGGIILAGALVYVLYKIINNDLIHLQGAVERQTEVIQDTSLVLKDMNAAVVGLKDVVANNTRVIEIFLRR